MTTAKKSVPQQNVPGGISNQKQVEYASGKASKFLPRVSIVGKPEIEVKRATRQAQIQHNNRLNSQPWNKTQPAVPRYLQSPPADAFGASSKIGPPTDTKLASPTTAPSVKAIPSLFSGSARPADQNELPAPSVLSQIANQLCGEA